MSLGGGVTVVEKREILEGWVTKVCSRWFVLPYFAAFRYNIGNNSKIRSGRKLKFGMLVESVLCYFRETKRMKSRLRFSSNYNLKKCNFFVLPYIVN